MKAIIDGKTYNTETATPIGGTIGPRDTFAGDFRDWSATRPQGPTQETLTMFSNYTWIATREDGSVYFAEIDIQTDRFMVQATFSDVGSHPGGQVIVSLADPEDRGSPAWSSEGTPIAAVDLPACISARRLRRAVRQAVREARYLLGTDYRWGVFDLRHYAGAEAEWKTAA